MAGANRPAPAEPEQTGRSEDEPPAGAVTYPYEGEPLPADYSMGDVINAVGPLTARCNKGSNSPKVHLFGCPGMRKAPLNRTKTITHPGEASLRATICNRCDPRADPEGQADADAGGEGA